MKAVRDFREVLREQRWDDHRFYHRSRINQSLHLVSAISFVCAYVLLFVDPAVAALVAWLVAMTTRQAGHFFFEPKGYDAANQVTHEYKEEVKVGYNLSRKVVLMTLWVLSPGLLWVDPTLFGTVAPAETTFDLLRHIGKIWLVIGAGALLFRVVQLWIKADLRTGIVWLTKILTDPFHDIWLYHRAPLYLGRGELIDPSIGPAQH